MSLENEALENIALCEKYDKNVSHKVYFKIYHVILFGN